MEEGTAIRYRTSCVLASRESSKLSFTRTFPRLDGLDSLPEYAAGRERLLPGFSAVYTDQIPGVMNRESISRLIPASASCLGAKGRLATIRSPAPRLAAPMVGSSQRMESTKA